MDHGGLPAIYRDVLDRPRPSLGDTLDVGDGGRRGTRGPGHHGGDRALVGSAPGSEPAST